MARAGLWTPMAVFIRSAPPRPWCRPPTGPDLTLLAASWPGLGPTAAADGFSTATGACTHLEGLLRSLRAPTGPDGTSRRASRGPAPAQAPAATPKLVANLDPGHTRFPVIARLRGRQAVI